MGKITKITAQKNKKRVNIFVDDEFKSGLDAEIAVKFGLKVGEDLDDEYLEFLLDNTELKSAFDVALNFITKTFKTAFEVKKKLYDKGYSTPIVEKTIEKLIEYKYIDDHAYAELFIKSSHKRSKKEIENKLRGKGIDKEIIIDLLNYFSDENEEDNAYEFACKYIKGKELNEKNFNNLIANLMRKGFSFELALKIKNKIKDESDDWC